MKSLILSSLASVALCASALAADPAPATKRKPLTEAEKAALREKRMQKTGGIVTQQGNGKVVIINAQKKYPVASVEKMLGDFRNFLRVNMEVREGTWKWGDKNPADANVVMFIVEDASLPMSLVAMEAGWGVMNVAPLTSAAQFERQAMRVAIATFGASVSQYKASPMQPVSKPEDLDAVIGKALTIDSTNSMLSNLQSRGVTRTKMTTYRKACQEGWAASPTNKYQKAIWDEVHTLPSNPIKIKYDPKRDK